MVENAQRSLGEVNYIRTLPAQMGVPMGCCWVGTDVQFAAACSSEQFLCWQVDFTFAEVLHPVDCWDVHSIDLDSMQALPLPQCYAISKDAAAHQHYWAVFEKVCKEHGFNFQWEHSVNCIIMDFHLGQALGLLRHLISIFGPEGGPQVFLRLVRGCQVHLKKILSKAIQQSTPSTGAGSPPADVKNFGKLAWQCYREVTSEVADRDTVDHALHTLSEMDPVLKRIVTWLSQPVVKAMVAPAYSSIESAVLQAQFPDRHVSEIPTCAEPTNGNGPHHQDKKARRCVSQNAAEGQHRARQVVAKGEPLNAAILTSYQVTLPSVTDSPWPALPRTQHTPPLKELPLLLHGTAPSLTALPHTPHPTTLTALLLTQHKHLSQHCPLSYTALPLSLTAPPLLLRHCPPTQHCYTAHCTAPHTALLLLQHCTDK
jgi:hypothetical protein